MGRVIVCSVGGHGRRPLDLPSSSFGDRSPIAGGERTLYELAVAAACSGHEVELRGVISRPVLDELVDAAGLERSRSPVVGLEPRLAVADELVVLPEGYREPMSFAPAVLSPARSVLLLLGPPGLFGWSFVDDGAVAVVDPSTVPLDAVARPEHFRAMAQLGFELWSNSPGTAAAGRVAGVACEYLGTGTPLPFPPLVEKTYDVAVVAANRWADAARAVVDELGDGVSCLVIPARESTVADALGAARVLVWPSRIEGDSRVQREARAMGTVPVALASNRFAAQLDDEHGAVVVDSARDLAPTIRRLLADRGALEALAARGVESARRQVDWAAYVDRVASAIDHVRSVPADDGRAARGAIGAAIERVLRDAEQTAGSVDAARCALEAARSALEADLAWAREAIADRESVLEGVIAELERLRREQADLRSGLDDAVLANASLAEQLAAQHSHVVELEAELDAVRARRAVRLADGLGRFISRGA